MVVYRKWDAIHPTLMMISRLNVPLLITIIFRLCAPQKQENVIDISFPPFNRRNKVF